MPRLVRIGSRRHGPVELDNAVMQGEAFFDQRSEAERQLLIAIDMLGPAQGLQLYPRPLSFRFLDGDLTVLQGAPNK